MTSSPSLPGTVSLWSGKPLHPRLDGRSHCLEGINSQPSACHTLGKAGSGPRASPKMQVLAIQGYQVPKGIRLGHPVPFRGERSKAQRGKLIFSASHSGKWPVGRGFKPRYA